MLEIRGADELRLLVRSVLSQKSDLDDSTPMKETVLLRRGEGCGVEFMLLGPREVRLSAIWAAQEKRVLFYDAEGKRFAVTAISGPTLDSFNESRNAR